MPWPWKNLSGSAARDGSHRPTPQAGPTFRLARRRAPLVHSRAPIHTQRRVAPAPAPRTGDDAMDSLRVLVFDDNSDAADSLSLLLRLWGHEPRVAHDGPEAMAAAVGLEPDVALLDIGLPQMDGFELGRRLRELPGLGDLPLVAMTGYADANARRRSEEARFLAHLVKPTDP